VVSQVLVPAGVLRASSCVLLARGDAEKRHRHASSNFGSQILLVDVILVTESVSVYAVLREGVFVAESDGVFREEGAKDDAHVRVLWNLVTT
jgi:hypothetical protein